MNPETSSTLSQCFFQEILTIYNRFSQANDELTVKFSQDISNIINKLFESLKGFEEQGETSANVLEGTRYLIHYLKEYEQGLEPVLGSQEIMNDR